MLANKLGNVNGT